MKLRMLGLSLLSLSIFPLSNLNSASATPTHLAEPAAQSNIPASVVDDGMWRTFTSAEGRFSILAPGDLIPRTVVLSTVKEVLQQFMCRTDDGTYLVQYADRPSKNIQALGAEKMLSIADDAFLKANHSTLISKRNLTLNGYPGHEIVANRYDGSKEVQRSYLVGSRRYTLLTVQRHNQAETASIASAKFFNSFALLPAKLPEMKRQP